MSSKKTKRQKKRLKKKHSKQTGFRNQSSKSKLTDNQDTLGESKKLVPNSPNEITASSEDDKKSN